MTNNTQLLPCPFCGGPGKLCVADYVHDDGRPWPIVECDNCHGWVPADAWNRRAAPAEDVRAVVEEPVNLQHMAVAENGVLRWMSGRKMQDCELYALTGGGAIRDKLYRHPQRPVVLPERVIAPDPKTSPLACMYANGYNAAIQDSEELNA